MGTKGTGFQTDTDLLLQILLQSTTYYADVETVVTIVVSHIFVSPLLPHMCRGPAANDQLTYL